MRHGETETPGRLLGRTDPALSDKGWAQFARQTDGRQWSAIVTSPRLRTRAAAERLAGGSGSPLRVDDDWAEVDFGDWDGRRSTSCVPMRPPPLRSQPSTVAPTPPARPAVRIGARS